MLPDRVSNPGPLTYESDALPIALRGLAGKKVTPEHSTINILGGYHSIVNFSSDSNKKRYDPCCLVDWLYSLDILGIP